MGWDDRSTISEMVGKVFTKVIQVGDEEVLFTMEDGSFFKMHHQQDCCESVYLEDVTGDLQDLIGQVVMVAEKRESDAPPPGVDHTEWGSYLWTFYELRTIAASVTLRWYGESNGYYSVDVLFMQTSDHEPKDQDTWQVAGDYMLSLGLTEIDQESGQTIPSVRDRYLHYFNKFKGK